ncbi:MAG: PilZ domain-containing protein [Acidobacteria bacterium]|nr:PilZ domain-containing protein [Acidobacteriota bacterium]
MATASVNHKPIYRTESRNNRRVFVELKSADGSDKECVDALTTDFSESGIGLLTYITFPIGTEVEVSLDDDVTIKGKVVNIEPWPDYDLVRLGICFLEKTDSWLVKSPCLH